MGFTTPCFIHKNTEKLRDELTDIGYILMSTMYEYSNKLTTIDNFVYFNQKDIKTSKIMIDCGYNEELFLAIASLRDDNDYNQWFTDGKDWYHCFIDGDDDHFVTRMRLNGFHKATVTELFEHFKK